MDLLIPSCVELIFSSWSDDPCWFVWALQQLLVGVACHYGDALVLCLCQHLSSCDRVSNESPLQHNSVVS